MGAFPMHTQVTFVPSEAAAVRYYARQYSLSDMLQALYITVLQR